MAEPDASESSSSNILPRREVIYCGACGMPPEYCEYSPDFETHCDPWLQKHHPELRAELAAKRGSSSSRSSRPTSKNSEDDRKDQEDRVRPDRPWTTEERLTAFYEKYVPEKVDSVPSLLEKYSGKEDKLFQALTKKYGPEPEDPYYADEDEEEDVDEGGETSKSKKRRGASAKKDDSVNVRIVIHKVAQKKKRNLTIVSGMESVPNLKLKDVSKTFSKKFAGSSSVKENEKGDKDIIIQGDHMYDVAELLVDKFSIPESCVFLDMDGDIVPLR